MPHFDPFITFVIGIANLQFKTGTGSCLVRGIDEADKLMIMYAIPTYVLLLVFVLAKVIRLYPSKLKLERKVIQLINFVLLYNI